MWGDDCALCGGPVGGNPIMVEGQDGSQVGLCPVCAMRFGTEFGSVSAAAAADPTEEVVPAPAAVEESGPDAPLEIQEAAALLARLADSQEREAAKMRTLARALDQAGLDALAMQDLLDERDGRIHSLEGELDRLRERLRSTEEALAPSFATEPPAAALPLAPLAPSEPSESLEPSEPSPAVPAPSAEYGLSDTHGWVPPDRDVEPTPVAPAAEAPEPGSARDQWEQAGLTGEDVRLAQRYFAESIYTEKTRAVRRSLGRPVVNLHPVAGETHRVMISIAWEIVWYQFLVDLAEDIPDDRRVQAFAEGLELSELSPQFLEDNATLDQGGRVDASELELALLAHPPELITEIPPERVTELEDATEEIWNKRSQPEFRWDD